MRRFAPFRAATRLAQILSRYSFTAARLLEPFAALMALVALCRRKVRGTGFEPDEDSLALVFQGSNPPYSFTATCSLRSQILFSAWDRI